MRLGEYPHQGIELRARTRKVTGNLQRPSQHRVGQRFHHQIVRRLGDSPATYGAWKGRPEISYAGMEIVLHVKNVGLMGRVAVLFGNSQTSIQGLTYGVAFSVHLR
jgi:hypothetical protein